MDNTISSIQRFAIKAEIDEYEGYFPLAAFSFFHLGITFTDTALSNLLTVVLYLGPKRKNWRGIFELVEFLQRAMRVKTLQLESTSPNYGCTKMLWHEVFDSIALLELQELVLESGVTDHSAV